MVGITSVLLLYVLVSTASISSREDGAEDNKKSKLPLVVSIPSKVSRANKMTSNDIFGPSSSPHSRTKLLAHSFPPENSTPIRTAATTESTTSTTSTTAATTTSDATTTSASTTTEATEGTTTTTERPSTPLEESAPSSQEHVSVTEPASTSATEGTTTSSTAGSLTDGTHETTVLLTSTPAEDVNATNAFTSKPADEVVERDYGQSLGHQHSEDNAGEVSSANNDEGGHTVDLDQHARQEESASDLLEDSPAPGAEDQVGVDEPESVQVEERVGADDRVQVEERAGDESMVLVEERLDGDIADEVDPMDEAAQASEVDYAAVAPEFLEHRPTDWDSDAIAEDSAAAQNAPSAVLNGSQSNDSDVRTSSTFSVAVLHPIGIFDAPEKMPEVAIPKDRAAKKAILNPKSKNSPSAAVSLPAPESNDTEAATSERTVLVLLDNDSSTKGPKDSSADKAASSASSTLKPDKASKKPTKPVEAENKDLEPAESAHDSPLILDPEGAEEGPNPDELSALSSDPEAGLVDEPSLLDSEVGASNGDPGVVNEEGEYEYVYEYIDVNSTDAPAGIPEGALLVSETPVAQLSPQQLPPQLPSQLPPQLSPQLPSQLPPQLQPPQLSQLPLPAEEVAPSIELADNGSLALFAPDGSRPPSFRNFGPASAAEVPLVGNGTGVELVQAGFQPLSGDRPIPAQAVNPIAAGAPLSLQPEEGALPFIPGLPDSPVYFVGLQREKILPGDAALPAHGPVLGKETISGHDTNALQDGKLEKSTVDGKGDEEQLNALYALSRALPLDDNLPFLISSDADANATVFLPPNLPDPFSDELLGEARKPESVFTTPAAVPTITSEEVTTTTTTATTTTTELPTTTTTTTTEAVTEAETTPAPEEKPVSKIPKRGPRPGGRRRPTTTTTAAASSSAETATAAPAASIPPRRGSRPNRVGGRRKTTAAVSSDSDGTTHAPDTTVASESAEKPTVPDRSRFGSRGRGRLGASTTPKAAAAEEAATSAPNKDRESNTIANGGSRRPLTTRRNNRVAAESSSSTNGEKEATSTRASGPARGGRRSQFTRNGGRNGEAKTTSAPSTADGEAEATTTRKASIFRPRGRGRFQPKTKVGAAAEQDEATEQSPEETHAAAESTANERKEESPVTSVPKEESASASESNQDDAASTESPATESSGPPRKFPPRFRPGARASIPHRSTEASN